MEQPSPVTPKPKRNDSSLLYISGLWEHTSEAGQEYLSGKVGPLKILIFKNEKRTKDTDPHWSLHFGIS